MMINAAGDAEDCQKHAAASVASRIETREMREGEEAEWDRFVLSSPSGTFFHLSGWKRVIERAFGHRTYYLIAERGPAVAGVLPLTHVKSLLFGSSLISNAFGVHGGPIAENTETLCKLEAEAVRLMDAIAVPVLELRDFSATRADWPSKKDLYASFRRSLDPSVEHNLKSIFLSCNFSAYFLAAFN